MTKKRKADASRIDEVNRTMYSAFCSAANSLSLLYTQAMSQQKLAFHAGERHSLEKLHQWIRMKHEEGSRVTVPDIISYMQVEFGVEDVSMSPRIHSQHQHPQAIAPFTQGGIQASGFMHPAGFASQTRSSEFCAAALSSPMNSDQGGYFPGCGLLPRNETRNVEANPSARNDGMNPDGSDFSSDMDMHSHGPGRERY